MSAAWSVIVVVGVATIGFKAVGPATLGGRELPSRVRRLIDGLAPAVLSALIVTQTLTTGQEVVVDARAAGVLSAVVLLLLKRPVWLALLVAVLVTAAVRWLG